MYGNVIYLYFSRTLLLYLFGVMCFDIFWDGSNILKPMVTMTFKGGMNIHGNQLGSTGYHGYAL